jgi:serine/threonine protein kinase
VGCIILEMLLGRPVLGVSRDTRWGLLAHACHLTGEQWVTVAGTSRVPELSLDHLTQGADPHLRHLLHGMLRIDPGNRITARNALNHPFFAGQQHLPIQLLFPPLTTITHADAVCFVRDRCSPHLPPHLLSFVP